MRVEYDTTLEDHEELMKRMLKPHRMWRKIYRRYAVLTPLVTAGVVIVFWNESMVRNGITAFIMLLGGFFIFPFYDRWSLRKQISKLAAWNREPNRHTHFVVELLAEGLATEARGVRSVVPWDRVASVGERDGYVELALDGVGLVIVAIRAFAGDNDRKTFVELAEKYRRAAVPPPPVRTIDGNRK